MKSFPWLQSSLNSGENASFADTHSKFGHWAMKIVSSYNPLKTRCQMRQFFYYRQRFQSVNQNSCRSELYRPTQMALWPIRFPFSLAFVVVGCSRMPVTTIIFTILGRVILPKFSALSFLEDVSATLSNLHVPLASWVENHSKTYLPGIAPAWGLSQKLARTMGTSRAKELHFTGALVTCLT